MTRSGPAARATPALRQMLKASAAAVDVVRRPHRGITFLIYHRVGAGNGGQMDLPLDVFEAQLDWLRDTQRVISLDQAADELSSCVGAEPGVGPGVEPGVVLTFDDGTTDWVDHVLPALERFSTPATFYVATEFVEEGVPFPSDGRPLDWVAVRELASSALVTIGSHTHRHLLLDRLPDEQIGDELDRSIELLSEHVDRPVAHFAYPKAVAGSPAADAAVRSRFRTAVLAGTRANRGGADLYRLARSPVQASDGSRWFHRKATGGLGAEDEMRQLANRVRYRGITA